MFWDDIKLVTEQLEKYGLRQPFVDLGGLARPTIADYDITIKTQEQYARYIGLKQRPFDHVDPEYLILNPENGAPEIEELPSQYPEFFGTAVCLNVIEHVEDPFQVFQALYDIMKPNSLLIIETVFSFPYHPSPRDYWRYSPDNLRHLAEKTNFQVLECDWRLLIRADEGIKVTGELPGLYKKNHPQEIMTVYATLTKGEFEPKPELGKYPLPQRLSNNARVRRMLMVENFRPDAMASANRYQKSPDTDEIVTEFQQVRRQLSQCVLELPTNELDTISDLHGKVMSSGIKEMPLSDVENSWVAEFLNALNHRIEQPSWEWVPEGWKRQDKRIKGWNVEIMVDIRKAQRLTLLEKIESQKLLTNDYGQHNTYMSYAYVLSLISRKKERISILDWGGGLGEYYLISQSLFPELHIDYYCAEVSVLCAAGREVQPEITFYDRDEDWLSNKYDLVLCSSALQYAEDWQGLANNLIQSTGSYLYIARSPIIRNHPSFVVLQRPYQYGYDTEYLSWFFNVDELVGYIESKKMQKVKEFLIAERFPVSGAPEVGEGCGLLFTSQTKE
ncbi:methyltransferase, TIGR04325 family [Roseofilum casamattae]|uniref:Methyltransferase, TIGR04325 family n=1 Tax=Roseofilum casamattae BLCC-M143 TaxID=3022442 RepID=A0ABT7BUL6_9CYAN|nr:methyltransferase, TIGR04325 family [Roseofilum casamattae]MDJ1182181.1 methyltransferase, TIGR04325 family [Roseofilum casamattae BLCC-M143]